MSTFLEKAEEQILFRQKQNNTSNMIFHTIGSSGNNPEKLAKILTTFDMIINILGWQEKPLANFSNILTQYQASINGKYHQDYKDVLISEEIDRKKSQGNNALTITQG